VPEPSYDPSNHFSIPMLADQNMSPQSAIAQRNHELLCVPESKDDVLTLAIQSVNLLLTFPGHRHSPTKQPDHPRPDRRQQDTFKPIEHLTTHEHVMHKA